MVRELAPAKLNLVLHVGPPDGGLHAISSLFASLELADELEAAGGRQRRADSVLCPGVEGENLAAAALTAFREAVRGSLPPLELRIHKRIPVAAGLGGGSADAAAALRAANRIAGHPLDARRARGAGPAARLGRAEPAGARSCGRDRRGEKIEPIALPEVHVVLVPHEHGLSAAEVYAELDRRDGWRRRLDPDPLSDLADAGPERLARALENDLEPAAIALRPAIRDGLGRLRDAGALGAAVSGSGPTCFGLFAEADGARQAAAAIPGAIATRLRRT